MPDLRRALTAGVLAVVAAAALAGDPETPVVSKAAAAAFEKAAPLLDEASRRLTERKWESAMAKFDEAVAALGDEPVLAGWRDQALYNKACAEARLGRPADAAATFAMSVAHGLRDVVAPVVGGAWTVAPGLRLEHLLADADLDPIRAEASYVAALKPFLAMGEPVLEFTRPETSSLVPALVVLAAEGDEAERALPAWRVAAKDAGAAVALVAVAGPVCARPGERRWLLGDGDERWAVAKVKEAIDLAANDVRIDRKRIFVVGVGARPGEAAWAGATADAARLAGFAAPGARFHAEWHADAVATLPETWRVAVGAADEKAAKLLAERKIEAARIEPTNDDAKTAAAILAALLKP